MEINNLGKMLIKHNLSQDILKLNEIFTGEIIEIKDNVIFINIPGKGIISAESELDLDKLLGTTVKFFVKSKVEDKFQVEPILDENILEPKEKSSEPIAKLLKSLNIKETEMTKNLIKSMMRYEISLNKDNINENIKTLDKIFQLIDIKDENLIFIDKEDVKTNEVLSEHKNNIIAEYIDIKRDNIYNNKSSDLKGIENKVNIIEKSLDNVPEIRKELLEDIKNIIIVSSEVETSKDLNKIVMENLSFFKKTEPAIVEENLMDIISFFSKNNIKPSINNIKQLQKLIDNPLEFIREFSLIIDKKGNLNEKFKSFDEFDNEKEIDINDKTNLLKKQDKNLDSNYKKIDLNPLDDLIEIKEKIEFMKELNRELYFHFIPLNYGKNNLEGLINIIKEDKKNKVKKNSTNIYISLDTNTLGNITISCVVKDENLDIKVGVNKEDVQIFESGKEALKIKLSSLGFKVNSFKFLSSDKPIIKDILISNEDPIQFLDIKV